MKKKENRLNTIIGMLREQPTLTIRELASILDVSEMTIRREFGQIKGLWIVSSCFRNEHDWKCTTERHFTSQI